MEKVKKIFGNINMSWKNVIFFAIITGAYTGIINQIPALKNTSFQDIAVTMEWWVLFAVIIAVNSKSAWNSALKIFAFFMISQPIVFLVELPMIGIEKAFIYYKNWFIPIILTLPGGFLAYYGTKKENIVGTLILSIATGLLAIIGVSYFMDCVNAFPNHLLTVIFCFAQIILLAFTLKKKVIYRGIVLAMSIVAIAIIFLISSNNISITEVYLPEGNWNYEIPSGGNFTANLDGQVFKYESKGLFVKEKEIIFTNQDGEKLTYLVHKNKNGVITIELKNN